MRKCLLHDAILSYLNDSFVIYVLHRLVMKANAVRNVQASGRFRTSNFCYLIIHIFTYHIVVALLKAHLTLTEEAKYHMRFFVNYYPNYNT